MAKHFPRFLRLIAETRPRIQEISVADVKARLDRGEQFQLIDVREDREWAIEHLPNAKHLGRGILERDIEEHLPDTETEIILYCGGGFRSLLAAENLQRMGYADVKSMADGIRGWRKAGFPLVQG